MARDQATVDCAAGAWTQLTNADVVAITFQVIGDVAVYIRATTDEATPTEDYGLAFQSLDGKINRAMYDLFNLTGAARLWAKPIGDVRGALVYVDHA